MPRVWLKTLDADIVELFEIEVQVIDHLPHAGQRLYEIAIRRCDV